MSRPALHLLGGPTLFDSTGTPLSGGPAQRHRLALLAELVIAAPNAVSRDRLIGTLWPDRDSAAGRRLLNVAVTVLRQALGPGTIVTAGDDLRLDSSTIDVDVHQFERALDEGRLEEAVASCRGAFLEGFFLDDAVEFERWVEAQRMRLARRYANALTVLAERATRNGDFVNAVGWWRALGHAEPTNPTVVLQLFDALVAIGDVTGALAAAEGHSAYMRSEVGIEPDARVSARVDTLRASLVEVRHDLPLPRVVPVTTPTETLAAAVAPPRFRLGHLAMACLLVILAAGTVAWRAARHGRPRPNGALVAALLPLVPGAGVPPDLDEGLADLLALNIGQLDGVQIVRPDRDRIAQIEQGTTSAQEAGRAMHAGVTLAGRMMADSTRITVMLTLIDSTGAVIGNATATVPRDAAAVPALVDAVSVPVIRLLWGRRWLVPEPRVAAVTTKSIPALQAFLVGEHEFRLAHWDSAATAYQDAADRDSTFALAYLRLSEAIAWSGHRGDDAVRNALNHAARFADELSPRDAIFLRYRRLAADASFGAVGAATDFALRYPHDPDALFSVADVSYHAGILLGIDPDSLSWMWDRAIAADRVTVNPLEHVIWLAMYAEDRPRLDSILAMRAARSNDPPSATIRLDRIAIWAPLQGARDSIVAFARRAATAKEDPGPLRDAMSFLVVRCVSGLEECADIAFATVDQVQRIWAGAGHDAPLGGRWGAALGAGIGRMSGVANELASTGPLNAANVALTIGILGYDTDSLAAIARRTIEAGGERSWRMDMRLAELALVRRDTLRAADALADAVRRLSGDSVARGSDTGPYSAPLIRAARDWITIVAGDTARGIRDMKAELQESGYSSEAGQESAMLRLELATLMATSQPWRHWAIASFESQLDDAGVFWPMIRLHLARTLDADGQSKAAAEQYRRFALVWRNADPPLRHFAAEALQRAAALGQGGQK